MVSDTNRACLSNRRRWMRLLDARVDGRGEHMSRSTIPSSTHSRVTDNSYRVSQSLVTYHHVTYPNHRIYSTAPQSRHSQRRPNPATCHQEPYEGLGVLKQTKEIYQYQPHVLYRSITKGRAPMRGSTIIRLRSWMTWLHRSCWIPREHIKTTTVSKRIKSP